MLPKPFLRSGHLPTLIAAFLYFDVSFMVWGLLGVLVNYIVADMPLSPSQKGLLVGTPILGGALLRLPMGILADRIGGRLTGILGMLLTTLPLAYGALLADSYSELLIAGLLLGISGASFAVALPLASRWYPLEHQGLALGIAGAGNSGTVIAALVAPRVAEMFGWKTVLGWAVALVALTLVVFYSLAQDSPEQPPRKKLATYFAPLSTRDAWTFCAFYCVTFGGFVGLANFLGLFFYEQYSLSRVSAGALTAAAVFGGSMLRPLGGWAADRLGGTRLLVAAFFSIAAIMSLVSTLPALPLAILLLILVMAILGAGNGIVFQLIPQRFQREIGVVTGIVGAAGGVGGFLLPTLLGMLKQATGSFAPGLACFAVVAGALAVAAWSASRQWASDRAILDPATT